MICYLDSSTVGRRILREPGPLDLWGEWELALFSAILLVEVRRLLFRVHATGALTSDDLQLGYEYLSELANGARVVPVGQDLLDRAASLPLVVKTLDAIHLATAIDLRQRYYPELVFATHDRQQALAAESLGFIVIGS